MESLKHVKPINDGIIFQFLEDVASGKIFSRTESGIFIAPEASDMKKCRWGKVLAIGDSVKNVNVGDYIFIENLKWTNKLKYKDSEFWKTNEQYVLLKTDEMPKNFI